LRTAAFAKGFAVSDATPHISREKMLQAIRDEIGLTDEEMEHLLSCAICIEVATHLLFPKE
jgi:hypothetical protein